MNIQRSNIWPILLLFLILAALFSPILFTSKIVRAPDILNEFYWGVYRSYGQPLWSMLKIDLSSAGWNPYINSGHTNDGGMVSMQFHLYQRLLFGLIPAPASVAWFMVLHLFIGGAGVYLYCRLAGCSRLAAFFGGFIFAFCTENASLINAGHVMKIATISYTPWVFYFLERGFGSNRWFYYLCTSMVLAFQFFNTHWQIAFYTCLAVAVYGMMRILEEIYAGEPLRKAGQTLLMGVVMVLFFMAASAISLAPLAGWSKDTNRGVHSGANQGKGGLDREEAMMWSLPPEETVSLVIPGLLGLSRQEGGDQPKPDQTYYWGRMVFTQTASYFGLLPWLLLPLPLLFKNDRITKVALVAVVGGLLFSMGKYTPFYQFLYDYLPGISRFRVPKMMLFMTAFGLAVLTARGIDLLRDEKTLSSPLLGRWFWWVLAFPLCLTVLHLVERLFGAAVREWLFDLLSRPTRYQQGVGLVSQRWLNLERETGIALALASLCSLLLLGVARHRLKAVPGILLLLVLLAGDLWRVNRQFLVLTDPPNRTETAVTPVMSLIKEQLQEGNPVVKPDKQVRAMVPEYRVLLLGNRDPMSYANAGIPVLFTSNAVQKRRWQEYLDAFSLQSSMPDMMNVRWVVLDEQVYEQHRDRFGDRYQPIFCQSGEVLLENRRVLPKAWLVTDLDIVNDPAARLERMKMPDFDPSRKALVESAPEISVVWSEKPGKVRLEQNQDELIRIQADVATSSLLVLGEKFQGGWKVTVDSRPAVIVPVNHILRGIYLTTGKHDVEFRFDPLPFRIGKWLTLAAFGVFVLFCVREWLFVRRGNSVT